VILRAKAYLAGSLDLEVEWRERTSVLKEAKFSRKFGSSGYLRLISH